MAANVNQYPCGVMLIEKIFGNVQFCNSILYEWLQVEMGQHFESHLNDDLRHVVFSTEECDKLLYILKKCSHAPVSKTERYEESVTTLSGKVLYFVGQNLPDYKSLIWIVNDVTSLISKVEVEHNAILRAMKCTSHDMRTPMQSITMAALQLKEREDRNSDEAENDIDIIVSSAKLLQSIMSTVLEFKNIDKLTPNYKPADVAKSLDRIINMLRHSSLISEETDLVSHCDVSRLVLLDEHLFDRIVLNIVTNALKFTQKGHVIITCSIPETSHGVQTEEASKEDVSNVEMSTSPILTTTDVIDVSGGGGGESDVISKSSREVPSSSKPTSSQFGESGDVVLRVQVIDTGCGMKDEDQAHLGEISYFTGNAGGFGLGTYIVGNYVEALHGKLSMESKVGVGTTVTVEIPIKFFKQEDLDSTLSSSSSTAASSLYSSSREYSATPRSNLSDDQSYEALENLLEASRDERQRLIPNQGLILVVEDADVNRKLIVKALQRAGFQVDQAKNGKIALEMMLKKEYRTVFMDVNMPVMNGYEAVQEYWKAAKHKNKNPPPKIIMLTGSDTIEDKEMALSFGAHDFLTKPVAPKQLKEAALWTSFEKPS